MSTNQEIAQIIANLISPLDSFQRESVISLALSLAALLPEPFSVGPDFIDHRGVRFYPPFYCYSCGRLIPPSQFASSRTCGACDTSTAYQRYRRLSSGGTRRVFAGRHDRLLSDEFPDMVFLDPTTPEGAAWAIRMQNYQPPKPPSINRLPPDRQAFKRPMVR